MPTATQRINTYFAQQPPFAKAMCVELRKLIHQAAPNIIEDWKWGPSFNHEGMVCNVGAFKHHVRMTFFHGAAMKDKDKLFNDGFDNLHSRAVTFTNVKEIPRQKILTYVREAVALNAGGRKLPVPAKTRPIRPMPAALKRVLVQHDLTKNFGDRPPYQRRDYISWVTDAKRQETRDKRLETIVDDLQSGRYMKMEWASIHRRKK